jgi:hypothetical protein
MPPTLQATLLLVLSNLFMTYAWYGHLRTLAGQPWWIAAVLSFRVAFFEYQLEVPANRIGFGVMNLPQLKILQEVITLVVFAPFAIWFMRVPIGIDFVWAGLCLLGAVFFTFRGVGAPV